MKSLILFIGAIIAVCVILLFLAVPSPEKEFETISTNYNGKHVVLSELPQLESTVVLTFASLYDGNVVVLVERNGNKVVEVWTPKLLVDVLTKGNK